MRRPVDFSLPLSIEEAELLLGALTGYIERWQRHYDEDGGQTHTPDGLNAMRTEVGHLMWRLEELAVLPGQSACHSEYAVRPPEDDDDDGGAEVREPRRPAPSTPPAAESYEE